MSIVSSVRWNDERLYKQLKLAATNRNISLNHLLIQAATEYLRQHGIDDCQRSELNRQTEAYMQSKPAFDTDDWAAGYDTSGWE